MKKIDLGQAVTLLANFGIIVGIIFLVLELRQNNQVLEFESLRTFNDRAISTIDLQISNPWLNELAFKDRASLTPEETNQLRIMAVRTLLIFEEQFEEILAGRRDPEELIASWRVIYWSPQLNWGMPDIWEAYKPRARSEFVQFIQKNIIEAGPLE